MWEMKQHNESLDRTANNGGVDAAIVAPPVNSVVIYRRCSCPTVETADNFVRADTSTAASKRKSPACGGVSHRRL